MEQTADQIAASNVRAAMAQHRWTRAALVAATGIPERTLARRLTGNSRWDVSELALVSEALSVPVAALVTEGPLRRAV